MANIELHIFVEKLQQLVENVEIKTKSLLKNELKPTIEDFNTEQLSLGMRSDGVALPDYSETSIKVFGKPRGRIKLYDTGDYYHSIEAFVQNNKLILHASDWKDVKLQKRFGAKILGLTEENIKILQNEDLTPLLVEKINEYFRI